MKPQNNLYIYNTRTGGQNPNWLGATYDEDGKFTPVLAVNGDNLPFFKWNITQDGPGRPYHLEILDRDGQSNRLVTSVSPVSGSLCGLQPVASLDPSKWFDLWCLTADDGRILLKWDICNSAKPLSLDTGKYPSVMVYEFLSSVNQTWAWSVTPPPK